MTMGVPGQEPGNISFSVDATGFYVPPLPILTSRGWDYTDWLGLGHISRPDPITVAVVRMGGMKREAVC